MNQIVNLKFTPVYTVSIFLSEKKPARRPPAVKVKSKLSLTLPVNPRSNLPKLSSFPLSSVVGVAK
jgi:hypothetical protein